MEYLVFWLTNFLILISHIWMSARLNQYYKEQQSTLVLTEKETKILLAVSDICRRETIIFAASDKFPLIDEVKKVKADLARLSIREGWFNDPTVSNVIDFEHFKRANDGVVKLSKGAAL